ncbi:hypothetical protein V7x_43570 [Crateriforma conspicua]|uniref:EamA-like transporter family protein n=2 Tax=Crateriforma conspicua TaxID=2527996 RepID=A0A5C6FN63_9PLAN|nr:hypothetical protein V7x_43570 [Crateriforma conspicua]
MMFASQAIGRGANVATGTFYGNLFLGITWVSVGFFRGEVAAVVLWPKAAVIGLLFLLGQFFTYCAYRFGDVSVATPVLGTKILFVAFISSFVMDSPVAQAIWIASFVATGGVALVQWKPRNAKRAVRQQRVGITILCALLAAITLSVFDLLLQTWGKSSGTATFLPVVFAFCAFSSLILLPWTTKLSELRRRFALRPMLFGSALMATQAIGMCIALSAFGDATRINIVYALRGLWAICLGWLLASFFQAGEQHLSRSELYSRSVGAILLTIAAIVALL